MMSAFSDTQQDVIRYAYRAHNGDWAYEGYTLNQWQAQVRETGNPEAADVVAGLLWLEHNR